VGVNGCCWFIAISITQTCNESVGAEEKGNIEEISQESEFKEGKGHIVREQEAPECGGVHSRKSPYGKVGGKVKKNGSCERC